MSTRTEIATAKFLSGYNCAQAVLDAFREETGLTRAAPSTRGRVNGNFSWSNHERHERFETGNGGGGWGDGRVVPGRRPALRVRECRRAAAKKGRRIRNPGEQETKRRRKKPGKQHSGKRGELSSGEGWRRENRLAKSARRIAD